MIDTGRWRICEVIAMNYPYSVQEVYDLYLVVLDVFEKREGHVSLQKQMACVKSLLGVATYFQCSPMLVADKLRGM